MILPIDLSGRRRVLFLGIGGGFDIYGSIPIFAHERTNTEIFVFANVNAQVKDKLTFPGSTEECPEYRLRLSLDEYRYPYPVYALPRLGVQSTRKLLQEIVAEYYIDTVVCVDGGVDSLMCGDEESGGTILEDFVTLQAVSGLNVKRVLMCVGFGTETEEGVSHHHALESMAALSAAGGILGCTMLTKWDHEYKVYRKFCEAAWADGRRKSHVHTKVISAVEGRFGDDNMYADVDPMLAAVENPVNYINPLMAVMWFFDLDTLLKRNKLAGLLENTGTSTDALMVYRQCGLTRRKREPLPL